MTSSPLWRGGDPWVDFRVLLEGEANGPATFVSVNRSIYIVDMAAGTYLRLRAEDWNTWVDDGRPRRLHELVAATPCGLRLRWGRPEFGEYTSTTRIIAVFVGRLTQLPEFDLLEDATIAWTSEAHPVEFCGAMYCADRMRIITIALAGDQT